LALCDACAAVASARNAVLHLPSEGGVEAALIRDLVAAVHDTHSGYVAFDRIVSDLEREYRDFPFPRRYVALGAPARWYPWFDPFGVADSFVFADERVIVARVELSSPGFWDFLGSLSPLEVIRKYLDDRHRRRQDRAYREGEEKRQLGLENDLREIEVIRRRLELARENGVPESTLQPLLQQLVGRPLEALGTLQDRGVIDGSSAEIRELESGEGPQPA
jgi:hypothetical protein